MTLLAAMITSGLFAILGPPYGHYLCWFSWSRTGAIIGTATYLLVAGAGGGLLGFVAGRTFLNANPTANPWLDGLCYGIAGAVALRADFRTTQKQSQPAHAIQSELPDAKSLLSKALQWTGSALDTWTLRKVERWLSGLDDTAVLDQGGTASARIANMQLTAPVKTTLQKALVPAMEEMRSSNAQVKNLARKRVEQFIATFTINHHLPKP